MVLSVPGSRTLSERNFCPETSVEEQLKSKLL